jgi:hypothetical protein
MMRDAMPYDLPLISCIMPTFNRRRFVAQAIRYFLCQDYPEKELMRRRSTAYCEISIPEWMFDYPSHFLRRIKNVSLTIPCVVGPYTGIHCRLTLLRSTMRVDSCYACRTLL